MDSLRPTMMDTKMTTMDKYIKSTIAKYGTIQECFWDDEIDAVLIPDRFLIEESIQDVLNSCTQEAWDHVYENRANYSVRIRELIEPNDFKCSPQKFKMRVLNMTDKDMINIEKERKAARMKEFESRWEEIKETISARAVDDLDDELDEAWDRLCDAKSRMTVFLNKKRKTYVPPSARNVVDPEQEKIEAEIRKCQAEFDDIEKRISEEDEKYMLQKKNEYFEKWLCEV